MTVLTTTELWVTLKPPRGTSLTYSREEMPHFLPWLVLALFDELRPEEIDRLAWGAVDLERGVVTIGALVAKVRTRRVVHLKPVAVEWLRLGADMPLPQATRRRCLRKLRELLGWPVWNKDVLRHSAASYWLASDPDTPRMAMELGNSPAIWPRRSKPVTGVKWILTRCPAEVTGRQRSVSVCGQHQPVICG